MEGIINLHHDLMAILIFILLYVMVIFGSIIYYFNATRYQPLKYYTGLIHHNLLELL